MKAIIPAAGSGTRLLPHTYTVPKPLVHVAGNTILGHILDDLEKFQIDRIGLIVGDKGERITRYVESRYNFQVDYVYQEERKGLGHAIYLYLKERRPDNEPMLIVLSDTIFEADLTEVLDSQYTSIAVHKVEDPRRFGIVELKGRFVNKLIEKPDIPTSDLAIVGVYFVKSAQLLFECLQQLIDKDVRTRGEYQLTDALQLMLDSGESMTTFAVAGWHDCGTPETLLQTNRYLLGKISKTREMPGNIIVPPVSIAYSAVVENSIVGPYVSIADGVQVTKSIIEDSIINENASIRNALIKESLIGDNAVFDGQFSRLNVGDSSQITFGQ
jgi:glucose-1-phosphate thymidylyltransferase